MKFIETIKKYKRPQPDRKFDQFYATYETVIKRANLILAYKEKANIQNIVFLGDDDLTSIALALSGKFHEIFVLDIDERILNLIKEIAKKENLNINLIHHDIRKALPKEFLKLKADMIFYDPPYTPIAAKIWSIRALQILLGAGSNKKRKDLNFLKNKFIFMCYGYTDKSLEKGIKIQKIITELGLIIQEKFRKFNNYTGAESINNESDLYIIQPSPLIDLSKIDQWKNKNFEERVYTWETN